MVAMPQSLKSCIPDLARVLNETPDALYERVRALDREGLLVSVPGKGPGSGVRATPESVAMLLIGLLASVSLTEVGTLARSFSRAVPIDSECPLTGAKSFHAALTRIFSDVSVAERVSEIAVRVNAGQSGIAFDGGVAERDMDMVLAKSALELRGAKNVRFNPAPKVSVFVVRKAPYARGTRISVSIPRETVHELIAAARKLLSEGDGV
jgi:hypothetical protein